jgi:uncharacterized protein YjlB
MSDVQAFHFEDDGETPNNPRLPMVVYRRALSLDGERDPALPFERAFSAHGWSDGWRNGILLVVGAYPRNGSIDQKRPGQIDHTKATAAIADVPLPEMDPVHGRTGPLMQLWKVS